MSTPAPHPLPPTSGTRTVLRVLGAVLLLAGLGIGGTGLVRFIGEFQSMDDGGPGSVLMIGAGGFLCVFGLAALNAGFLGAQSRYVAGETMPAVKQSAAYLSDGQGIMGVGRTVDDRSGTAATGPFCRGCGTRNDDEARFCDGCGAPLA